MNRKEAILAVKNSRKISNVDTTEIWGENTENNVFPNLTPLNLRLRFYAKKMKGRGFISSFGSSVFGVWVKLDEDSDKEPIGSEDELAQFLPEDTLLSDLLDEDE